MSRVKYFIFLTFIIMSLNTFADAIDCSINMDGNPSYVTVYHDGERLTEIYIGEIHRNVSVRYQFTYNQRRVLFVGENGRAQSFSVNFERNYPNDFNEEFAFRIGGREGFLVICNNTDLQY